VATSGAAGAKADVAGAVAKLKVFPVAAGVAAGVDVAPKKPPVARLVAGAGVAPNPPNADIYIS